MSKTSNTKEIEQRRKDLWDETNAKANRLRHLANDGSTTEKEKISTLAAERREIEKTNKQLEETAKRLKVQFEEEQNIIKLREQDRKNTKGAAREALELEIKERKSRLANLQVEQTIVETRKLSNKSLVDEISAIEESTSGLKDQVNVELEKLQIKEKETKLAKEQKELAEEANEAAEKYSKYSYQVLKDKEDELKAEKAEQAILKGKYNRLSEEDKNTKGGKALKAKIDASGLKIASDETSIEKLKSDMASVDKKPNLTEGFSQLKDGLKEMTSTTAGKLDLVVSAVNASRSFFNNIVDSAATSVASYYGPITAALEGIQGDMHDYQSVANSVEFDVGLSSLVKQTTVMSNISELVRQGITSDIEAIGILNSIKDKTISSFNTTNGDLRRLVRLNQQRGSLTAKQFGLADALKESFNATFGDTSFLNDMFQSLTGTVLDAVSANAQSGGTDSTAFYSVLESWLGAMYESGVDNGTVNSIAQGINYLGSGNISALSGNKQLQNLMLLSMDRAGLDYASVLQQGLSDGDMNKLLSTIVDYLAEITSNTKDNNVLQSSYASLFNMSITDMTAIQNLSKSGYSALGLSGADALTKATKEINAVGSRTAVSEKIDNVVENIKYAFGSSIADNGFFYTLYKTSNFVLDTIDSVGNMVAGDRTGVLKKGVGAVYDAISGPVRMVGSIAYMTSLLPGIVGVVHSLGGSVASVLDGNGLNSLADVIADGLSGGIYDGSSSTSAVISTSSKSGSSTLKQFSIDSTASSSGISDTSTWENDAKAAAEEDDETTKILKEFEKTLMKAKEGEGYAFAVSLQGMSDGVLRSFASIFADEDAMMNTMTGNNNALADNNTFIDYINSNETKTTTTDTTTKV